MLLETAASQCDAQGRDTTASLALYDQSNVFVTKTGTALAVQAVCEAIALLLVAFSFLVLVTWSVAKYRLAEKMSASTLQSLNGQLNISESEVSSVFAEADYRGKADAFVKMDTDMAVKVVGGTLKTASEQRRRLISACILVFITFPARAAFDLLNAYSSFNDPYNPDCSSCGPCQTLQNLIFTWLQYTPEFQPVSVALSSSLPLAWSLWLMMSPWERRHLRLGFDKNKTELERLEIVARARLGVELPRPLGDIPRS